MSKSDLVKYAWESNLMEISIKHGKDTFSFNLNSEIIIDENRINKEIMEQPSAYAFLGMLHKKLIRKAADKEREMKKTYAKQFIRFKKAIDETTGRPNSNELAKEKATASDRYSDSQGAYANAQHECDIIEVCVRAFEQRHSLIQTLSANIRKTN